MDSKAKKYLREPYANTTHYHCLIAEDAPSHRWLMLLHLIPRLRLDELANLISPLQALVAAGQAFAEADAHPAASLKRHQRREALQALAQSYLQYCADSSRWGFLQTHAEACEGFDPSGHLRSCNAQPTRRPHVCHHTCKTRSESCPYWSLSAHGRRRHPRLTRPGWPNEE